MIWSSEAPSNIALIKYMGKVAGHTPNEAANPSLSYTLEHLRSRVTIEASLKESDFWEPLQDEVWHRIRLSEAGIKRFLSHWQFLKSVWEIPGYYKVQSANNFASDCGMASSASSFAALTSAAYKVAKEIHPSLDLTHFDLAHLSRQGSGSSCRSFFGPFCLWKGGQVDALELKCGPLKHQVVVVDDKKKTVSSSEAHKRVLTSLLFEGRAQRVNDRLEKLTSALNEDGWASAHEICWAEFWDMHSLFETSEPHFGYMNSASLEVLNVIGQFWQKNKVGPIVTMDAGPNVHLLYLDGHDDLQSSITKRIKKVVPGAHVF